jgi:Pyrimidine dimer DNA glycosylase/Protein of unknown function (DUF1722)
MRVWDVAPGYLNRGSLLGEHREIHGIAAILAQGKRGYSRHPETLRWTRCEHGLVQRHLLLVAEMRLRGYRHTSPMVLRVSARRWPRAFVTEPADQFVLLGAKYRGRESGRIQLPRTTQELWRQHKYSVMAREPELYRSLGRRVSRLRHLSGFRELAAELVSCLRNQPTVRRTINAIEHMWGHVSRHSTPSERRAAPAEPRLLLRRTQELATQVREPFVCESTALSELAVYLDANG